MGLQGVSKKISERKDLGEEATEKKPLLLKIRRLPESNNPPGRGTRRFGKCKLDPKR